MKKIIAWILCALLVINLCPVAALAADNTEYPAELNMITTREGNTITVVLTAPQYKDIVDLEYVMEFNKDALELTSVTAETFESLDFEQPSVDTANKRGSFYVGYTSEEGLATVSGKIALLTFKVKAGVADGNYSIRCKSVKFDNEEFKNILTETDKAKLPLQSEITVAQPFVFADDEAYDIPAGAVDEVYTAEKAMAVTGGMAPYTFAIDPAVEGLSINSDNKLVYTRAAAGAAKTATVKVTDSSKPAANTASITINIGAVSPKAVANPIVIKGLTAPVRGEAPDTEVTLPEGMTAESVTWTPSAAAFEADTAYTATIAYTVGAKYALAENVTVTAPSGAEKAVIDTEKQQIVVTYPVTAAKDSQTVSAEAINAVYGDTGVKVNVAQGYHGILSYRVISGDDVIAVAADGSVTIKKAGQAKIEVKASGDINYAEATTKVAVTVNAKEITPQVELTLPEDGYTYDNNAKTPSVTVKDGESVLTLDKDYTVSYENNINAGTDTAKAVVKAVEGGNYAFTAVEKVFSIAKAEQTIKADNVTVAFGNIAEVKATAEGAITFEAKTAISEGTTFDAASGKVTAGNVEGTFTVTVKAAATENYNEAAKDITVSVVSKKAQAPLKADNIEATYGDEGLKVAVADGYVGTLSYEVTEGADVISVANDGTITVLKAGEAKVKVTASGDDEYAEVSADVTVKIAKKQIAIPAADTAEYTYTGVAQSYQLAANEAYDIVDVEQTAANEAGYTVKAVLKDTVNTCWSDETTADKEYTFIIKKATITITADNLKAYIGKDAPTPTYKVTGLVNNETLQTEPKAEYATTPDMTQKGTTVIKVSGALASENYNIVYVDGLLTVTKKDTTISGGGGGGAAVTYYSLSFQTNGGSSISSLSKESGYVVSLSSYQPTKEGYTFAGWYTDSALTTKVTKVTLTKDTTVHAKWEKAAKAETTIILTINNKTAVVNNKAVINDVPPVIVNSRTFTPARFVAEQLGAKVEWNEAKQLVTVTAKDTVIELTIGSNTAYVNGQAVQMDTAAFILDGRTFTPARFVAEQLGATVEWNEQAGQVVITK